MDSTPQVIASPLENILRLVSDKLGSFPGVSQGTLDRDSVLCIMVFTMINGGFPKELIFEWGGKS